LRYVPVRSISLLVVTFTFVSFGLFGDLFTIYSFCIHLPLHCSVGPWSTFLHSTFAFCSFIHSVLFGGVVDWHSCSFFFFFFILIPGCVGFSVRPVDWKDRFPFVRFFCCIRYTLILFFFYIRLFRSFVALTSFVVALRSVSLRLIFVTIPVCSFPVVYSICCSFVFCVTFEFLGTFCFARYVVCIPVRVFWFAFYVLFVDFALFDFVPVCCNSITLIFFFFFFFVRCYAGDVPTICSHSLFCIQVFCLRVHPAFVLVRSIVYIRWWGYVVRCILTFVYGVVCHNCSFPAVHVYISFSPYRSSLRWSYRFYDFLLNHVLLHSCSFAVLRLFLFCTLFFFFFFFFFLFSFYLLPVHFVLFFLLRSLFDLRSDGTRFFLPISVILRSHSTFCVDSVFLFAVLDLRPRFLRSYQIFAISTLLYSRFTRSFCVCFAFRSRFLRFVPGLRVRYVGSRFIVSSLGALCFFFCVF